MSMLSCARRIFKLIIRLRKMFEYHGRAKGLGLEFKARHLLQIKSNLKSKTLERVGKKLSWLDYGSFQIT